MIVLSLRAPLLQERKHPADAGDARFVLTFLQANLLIKNLIPGLWKVSTNHTSSSSVSLDNPSEPSRVCQHEHANSSIS